MVTLTLGLFTQPSRQRLSKTDGYAWGARTTCQRRTTISLRRDTKGRVRISLLFQLPYEACRPSSPPPEGINGMDRPYRMDHPYGLESCRRGLKVALT